MYIHLYLRLFRYAGVGNTLVSAESSEKLHKIRGKGAIGKDRGSGYYFPNNTFIHVCIVPLNCSALMLFCGLQTNDVPTWYSLTLSSQGKLLSFMSCGNLENMLN